MNYQNYIKDATRTESCIETAQVNQASFSNALEIFTKAGQVLDLYKRQIFYGKDFNSSQMKTLLDEINALASKDIHLEKDDLSINTRILHASMGLATEAGEIIEAIEPAINGQVFDDVNYKEELGDVNWYQAIALDEIGMPLEEVLDKNIKKLKARFPEKFTEEKAIDRDLNQEREILEGD